LVNTSLGNLAVEFITVSISGKLGIRKPPELTCGVGI
jgi:hypothetical protein